jgi:hypothetical protein
LAGVYSTIDARQPETGYYPSLVERYGAGVPPGYDQRSEGVMIRISVVGNTSRDLAHPDSGTLFGLSVGGFASTQTSNATFTAYRCELQRFLPLWYTKRSLALRGYVNFIVNTGIDPIPFQRMFINEVPDMFRGYDTSRWRDVGITGFNVEYRFPCFADRKEGSLGIDTVLLADIGQVFDKATAISIDNLTQSYGFGFRAYMDKYFLGSMAFVWSDDGFQFRVSTSQLFQYSKDVLFQGREETLIH